MSGNWNWEMSVLLLVKRLGWLNVTQRRDYFMGVLMHRCIFGNVPNYLKDLLIQVSHVQQRLIRASNEFYVPCVNIELYKESFLYNGLRLWNTLAESLKVLPELRSFKCSFKSFLKTE